MERLADLSRFSSVAATPDVHALSLHDALPISSGTPWNGPRESPAASSASSSRAVARDRKSTRLNSSHTVISYAVFCLKKKNSGFLGHASDATHRTGLACLTSRERTGHITLMPV